MKYRLTEDWLEYKKGHVFEDAVRDKEQYVYFAGQRISPIELSLLVKTGILEDVTDLITPSSSITPSPSISKSPSIEEVKEEEWPKGYYWYVNEYGEVHREQYVGYDYDKWMLSFGNCFTSETAAKEASEKIKTLLLSLKK